MSIETPWANDVSGGTKLNQTRLNAYTPIRGSFTNPNNNVIGSPGNTYLNTTGGAGITLWVKETGVATTTGWVAAGSGTGGTGPAGPTGPQGPAGPTGPQGPAGSGAAVATQDEGTTLTANTTALNFTGAGVSATASSGNVTVAIPGGGAGSGIPASTVTAKGDLIAATGNGAVTNVPVSPFAGQVLTAKPSVTTGMDWENTANSIIKYQGGTPLTSRQILNFTGAGVSVADNASGLSTDIIITGAGGAGASTSYTPLSYNTSGFTNFVQIPTDQANGGNGGNFKITLTQDTSPRLLDYGLGEVCNIVNVLLIQDATGGHAVNFAPSNIHWVPNVGAHLDTIDTNWNYYGTRTPGPTIDPTPNSRTYCRFTYMGALGGWLGEVVAYIPPLYTAVPATFTNTINATGNPHTVYLTGGIMRGVDSSSVTNWLNTLTNPTWVSDAHRQRMANHGGSIWLNRTEPSDAPPIAYSRGTQTGSGLTTSFATCYADAGFGPGYPPGYDLGNVQGGTLHEYSHMEDAAYYNTSQPEPTFGTIQISQHTPIQNVFNACLALGAPPVGANPTVLVEWYAEMRRDQRLAINANQLAHCGTGTSGTAGLVTPQNRVDSFNNYINSLNGGAGLK